MKLNLQEIFSGFSNCKTKKNNKINLMTLLKSNDKEFYINVVKWID